MHCQANAGVELFGNDGDAVSLVLQPSVQDVGGAFSTPET